MKKITINPLDPASVRKALAALEKYERDVEKAADVYTKELASIGREAAYWAYSPAGVQLDVERIENGHKIVAKHDQIMFLEFGAGVWTGADFYRRYSCTTCGITVGAGTKPFVLPDDFAVSVVYVF